MKKRSMLGIILTAIGVVLIVAGVSADMWFKGGKPGFNEGQWITVLAGLLLFLVGWILCARKRACSSCCSGQPEEKNDSVAPTA